jgi:hypothetical protein
VFTTLDFPVILDGQTEDSHLHTRRRENLKSHVIYLSQDGNYDAVSPNVVVEWLAFLLRIREVPGSNLGPETGYPD